MAPDIKGVSDVINRYLESYVKRNVDLMATTIAQDSNTIGFGTDAGEYWKGWTTIKNVAEKQFKAIVEVSWTRGQPQINFSRDGNVAWYAEELVGNFLSGNTKTTSKVRFTCVLEKRNNNWLITQFHRSVPVEKYAVPYLETHGVSFD